MTADPIGIQFVAKDLPKVVRNLHDIDAQRKRAGLIATKKEAYRLMKAMKSEIRAGAPGGHRFRELTEIGKRLFRGERPRINRTPLNRLSAAVRYHAALMGKQPVVSVGFLPLDSRLAQLRGIAAIAQKDRTVPVTDAMQDELKRRGKGFKKKRSPIFRYFFLKKQTKFFHQKGRPIVDPFWHAHKAEIGPRVKHNWVIQMNKAMHKKATQMPLLKGWG